jgi:predicted ATPase/transcriptional regulator with XRE-family HTH domain/tetratricopeptide (TPR) repeat protein
MDVEESFGDSLQRYLRNSGYAQKQLADALGLNPKVLSRKINGSNNAYLTHLELQRIIVQLANWRAITTHDEARRLLASAGVEPSIISEDVWQTAPLSMLTGKRIPFTVTSETSLPTSTPLHNLPAQTTQLIGREWAVGQLRQRLERDDVRLITLVGPGGSGKTRLALHIASELAPTFTHGVWFIELAGVRDAGQVPLSIIQALNITPTSSLPPLQSLISYLKNKCMLLILDNFEQVAEASTILAEMLTKVPGLKVLVTSRAVLHMYGEHKFSVPPLDVPVPDIKLKTTELLQYGAVQLFVERAQAAAPDFVLTAENAQTIAEICFKVDGLPLALELAAARIRVLSPEVLLERLTQAPLSMLTKGARNLPDRQQTLRNTIVWSYNLLTSVEQAWFCRLGLFTGGWSLEAAEAMLHAIGTDQENADALDILEQLVDNSLVVRWPSVSGQTRFFMLETLREYALEQLTTRGELERLRDWHASYYMKKAEAAELGLRGPRQFMWLARLTIDRNNFRAVMEWSLQRARQGLKIRTFSVLMQETHGRSKVVAGSRVLSTKGATRSEVHAIELCLRLAASFRPYWEWHGYLMEARAWLGAALAIPIADESEETVLAARAKALSENARLVSLQNNQARAIELAEASIALWQRLNDASGLATALLHRGWAAHALDDYATAQRVYREGLQLLSAPEDSWLRGQILCVLAAAVGFAGDFEQMRTLYAQSRAIFEQLGDKSSIADLLKDSGGMAILESQYTEAIDNLLTSLKMCDEMGHKQYLATGMGWLSFAFGLREQPDATTACIYSAQLEGATDSLMDSIGLTPWLRTHPLTQWARQQIRSRVDKQTWEEAYTAGRALSIKQAIDLAYIWRNNLPAVSKQANTQEGYSSTT